MNELIKLLAEQARQYANSMYPSGLDIPKWGPAYHKKFSELIILETLDQVNENMELTWIEGEVKIKQHFGINE